MILATSPVGRAPARHRGRDTVEWLVECGFFQQRPQDLVDPSVMAAPQPLLAPGGRSISLQALSRAGITLAGRLVAADREQVAFDPPMALDVGTIPVGWWCGPAATSATSPGFPRPPHRRRPARKATGPPRCPGSGTSGCAGFTHRASGNFLGFATDAATTADAVAAHLTEGTQPTLATTPR